MEPVQARVLEERGHPEERRVRVRDLEVGGEEEPPRLGLPEPDRGEERTANATSVVARARGTQARERRARDDGDPGDEREEEEPERDRARARVPGPEERHRRRARRRARPGTRAAAGRRAASAPPRAPVGERDHGAAPRRRRTAGAGRPSGRRAAPGCGTGRRRGARRASPPDSGRARRRRPRPRSRATAITAQPTQVDGVSRLRSMRGHERDTPRQASASPSTTNPARSGSAARGRRASARRRGRRAVLQRVLPGGAPSLGQSENTSGAPTAGSPNRHGRPFAVGIAP